jgi:hypothetical protein
MLACVWPSTDLSLSHFALSKFQYHCIPCYRYIARFLPASMEQTTYKPPHPSSYVVAQAVSRGILSGGPGSRPGQSMWDLWWTKWQWNRLLSESLFSLAVSFHRCPIFIRVSSGGWAMGPPVAQFHRDIVSPHRNINNYPHQTHY